MLSAVLRWAVLQSSRKRGETALVFIYIAANVALVAFEIIAWPIAVLPREAHAMASGGFEAPEALASVAEEAD